MQAARARTERIAKFAQSNQPLERSHGGLGVGLTLVKAVVDLHGGRVAAYSRGRGSGTEIVLHLPTVGGGEGLPG